MSMTYFTTLRNQFVDSFGLTLARASFVTSLAVGSSVSGQSIAVPNASFESPTTPPGFPAFPQVDQWQKTPEVPGIPLPGGITWDQLSGVFPNTPAGSGNHIDNLDGAQAAYILAIPGVGLYQSLSTSFEAGKSYSLSVGILGGGGIAEGSTFELGLFYTDAGNSLAPVAATSITYTPAAFPNATHLLDYQVTLPAVQATDAWAGKNIGIRLLSTFGTGAGYWDLDQVRLTVVPEPTSIALVALGFGGMLMAVRRSRSVL
ncbi:MAG: PEP-CTERM sorting domain-containing protein [Verrucomicrobiales bacterium]|nr:PEP-CTERM sorting domain-containing protein [Verrucomicrobiales bacterium]